MHHKTHYMNNEIRLIQPKILWNNFTDLNSVPRPSKEEEKVIDFLIQFAKKLNLNYFQDNIGNLIIVKPSTEDMKDCKTIVLQSHVDMVHEKNNDVDFDFKNGPQIVSEAISTREGCQHRFSQPPPM